MGLLLLLPSGEREQFSAYPYEKGSVPHFSRPDQKIGLVGWKIVPSEICQLPAG